MSSKWEDNLILLSKKRFRSTKVKKEMKMQGHHHGGVE